LVAHYAGAININAGGPTEVKLVVTPVSINASALIHKGRHVGKAVNPVLVRPSAGKGPDQVSFALRAKNFFGTNLKQFTFKLDMVMSIRWEDPRVVALIPPGLDKVSMGWEQAVKLVWMPGIVVSNRDIEKYEIISASVTIFRSGEVHRVERANSRIMKKFMLEDYPFDTQDLDVNIASSKYMLDEVVLVPDKTEFASGVEENIWGLYDLNSWKTSSIESFDGDLKKSRGILNINVKRALDKYSQDHLIPSSIVLMISWAVFYFPFANPFITARLALSILALLTFTNLIVKSTKELPGAAPFNWNDLLNQQIQTLMFITIIVNICSEVMMHQFNFEEIARAMNHEAKVLLPGMGILNIILILTAAQSPHWLSIGQCKQATKWLIIVFLAIYITHVLRRVALEQKAMANAPKGDGIAFDDDAADDAQDAGGDDGGDADAGV